MISLNFKKYKLHLFITVVYFTLYVLNNNFFSIFTYKEHIHFIYLPAGLRFFLAAIYREDAWVGIFLGSFFAMVFLFENTSILCIIFYAILSATVPILTIYVFNIFHPLGKHLENLNLKLIVSLAFVYAVTYSFFYALYGYYVLDTTLSTFYRDWIATFVGDLTGSMIFLTILASQRHHILKFLRI